MIYFLSLRYFKTVFVGLEPVRIKNVTWKEKCTNRTLYSKIIPRKPRNFVGRILISGLYVEQLAVITARVRSTREGNVFETHLSIHHLVHRGGVPISHNAFQHFGKNAMRWGGYPDPLPDRVPPPPRGGSGTPPPGGYPVRNLGPPPPQGYPPPGGGTRVGQQKELHGGRYASCSHRRILLIFFLRPIFGFKAKFWKENGS